MAKKRKIDFGGVEKEIRKGGGRVRVPEGDYLAKVVDSSLETNKAGDGRYFRWTLQILEPKEFKGKKLGANTSLKKDALWNLRNLIHAATGKNVAGKSLEFDPEKLYGKIIGIAVSDNEYTKDGKTTISSQVDNFFPRDEYAGAEDDEEEDEDTETEDDDEEEEDDDLEEVDTDEL